MDGQSYSQPLYVTGLTINGSTHNVIFLTTQHDSVYAFDADSDAGANAFPLWRSSLLPPGTTSVPQADTGSGDIGVEIGITATPVIDLATQTLYTVSKVKVTATSTDQQWLHALDLTTGAEKFGGPIQITPTFAGSGPDASGGLIPFNPLREHGRPALALQNGIVYVCFASHGDAPTYHGEILGYDAATLQLVKTFITTPNADQAGVWQGGASPAFDSAGNLYVMTGNGAFDQDASGTTTGTDWGESILKIPPTGPFTVAFSNPLNWFTPSNYKALNMGDLDLGSSGVLILPDQPGGAHPHLLVGGGKGGTLYVIDRDSMGGFQTPDQSVQEITETNGIFVTPAYFNDHVYYAPAGGKLTQRAVGYNATDHSYLSTTATTSNFTYTNGLGTGVFISANGNQNGLVWAIDRSSPAHLHAYNASSVAGDPIYVGAATLPGGVDCSGVKFSLPTVANGKVYFTAYDPDNVGYLMAFAQPAPTAGTPVAPSNLTAAANSFRSITLKWTDNSTNELGFTIKRSTSPNGPFAALSPNANANETSYVDTGLAAATTYYYQVVAFNANGNSAFSPVASAATFPFYAPTGLVAYWNFDEGTGNVVNDSTGHGISGTLSGEFSWTPGYNNTAVSYHGTGEAVSRVTVPDSANLRFGVTDSFTVSAWIHPNALRSIDEAVIAKSRDTGNYYGLWINAANQWAFRGPSGEVTGPVVTPSAWSHVAIVQDGAAGTRRIYVNGNLAGSGAAQPADGTGDLWIGQANAGGGTVANSFPGLIDEVRVYQRALGASEIPTLLGPAVLEADSTPVQGVAAPAKLVLSPSKVRIIESREGPATGSQYKIFLNFAAPVSGIAASLVRQDGGAAIGHVNYVIYDATNTNVIVSLGGVANAQALNLHLSGVQPGNGTADIPFNVLWGDVNQDGLVASVDVALIAAHHQNWVDHSTACYDLNCDGIIDATDDALVSSLVGTALGPQTDTNLSFAGTATASSVEQPGITEPGAAIDGATNTRWSSNYADPQWLEIDLGRPYPIHSAILDWETAAGQTYFLQACNDDHSWANVWSEANNQHSGLISYTGANVTARYVRMYGTTRVTPYGYSLWELQILGTDLVPPPVISGSLAAAGVAGNPFSYQITARNRPTTFSASGLPNGLSIDPSTGTISGTPTSASTTQATISATNAGGTDSRTLTLAINTADANLALGLTPTASSSQSANPPANATDGSTMTRWAASGATWPQSWSVDLGTSRTLSRVDISWYSATTRAYKYRIETSSDNVNFTPVVDHTGNTTFGNTSDPFVASARFLRITITGGTSSGAIASAYEFKVYGH